jgi:hypothetical protein
LERYGNYVARSEIQIKSIIIEFLIYYSSFPFFFQQLAKVAVQLAKSKGYKRMVVESVNPATTAIFMKSIGGSKIMKEIPAREFTNKAGIKPWEELPESDYKLAFLEVDLTVEYQ